MMGILNVTPDSFHDGGKYVSVEKAVAQARQMFKAGAHIIDVGGESTHPGAIPISAEEELKRVIPVIKKIKSLGATISIDTTKTKVMQEAINAGATMVNDVKALSSQGAMELIAKTGVQVCLVHHKPAHTMQTIINDLKKIIDSCLRTGIKPEQIIIDPGFGFGKKGEQNIRLLQELERLKILNVPILVGLSRKSMNLEQSIAAAKQAILQGANIIRVHDVQTYCNINHYLS